MSADLCHCGRHDKAAGLVAQAIAARHLGISWRTFDKRRKAAPKCMSGVEPCQKRLRTGRCGCSVFDPDHTDPDSGFRFFDLMRIDDMRRRLGELDAEAVAS